MRLYTLFLGNKLWENVIDDMNSGDIWGTGGLLWKSKSKAKACLKNLQSYEFEDEKNKFSIRQLSIT